VWLPQAMVPADDGRPAPALAKWGHGRLGSGPAPRCGQVRGASGLAFLVGG